VEQVLEPLNSSLFPLFINLLLLDGPAAELLIDHLDVDRPLPSHLFQLGMVVTGLRVLLQEMLSKLLQRDTRPEVIVQVFDCIPNELFKREKRFVPSSFMFGRVKLFLVELAHLLVLPEVFLQFKAHKIIKHVSGRILAQVGVQEDIFLSLVEEREGFLPVNLGMNLSVFRELSDDFHKATLILFLSLRTRLCRFYLCLTFPLKNFWQEVVERLHPGFLINGLEARVVHQQSLNTGPLDTPCYC